MVHYPLPASGNGPFSTCNNVAIALITTHVHGGTFTHSLYFIVSSYYELVVDLATSTTIYRLRGARQRFIETLLLFRSTS